MKIKMVKKKNWDAWWEATAAVAAQL